ncbi:hypothetical protein EMA8858_01458 [Emticicia aquatica]|uniref:DUF2283 domain-containing protein n=1 Tax=Emticicia aquatica TaxID=1681835 RepID=A0ABN8ER23_9BACT|nr:hypothetical protein EMA8858_01458 [Emticicia aquatica]
MFTSKFQKNIIQIKYDCTKERISLPVDRDFEDECVDEVITCKIVSMIVLTNEMTVTFNQSMLF